MNDVEILANIFSKSVILKDFMLILDGCEAKAYKGDNGEWYIETDACGIVISIGLNEIKDIGWSKNVVTFTWGGEPYWLQLVQVLDLNQFRFAK